jgi:cupin 2 domain-containing protein
VPSPRPPERRGAGNLFRLPGSLPPEELVEALARGDGVLIERIVSAGQATAPGEWLEGELDEWVVLLAGEAELSFDGGGELRLVAGDHILIPAGERHRVESTSAEPPCVWLAVHAAGLSS